MLKNLLPCLGIVFGLSLVDGCDHPKSKPTGTPGAGGSGGPGTGGSGAQDGGAGQGGSSSTSGAGGATGGGGSGSTGAGGANVPSTELIDNLDDNDARIMMTGGRQGPWHSFNDSNGGNQQPPVGTGFMPASGGANSTPYAVHTTGSGY